MGKTYNPTSFVSELTPHHTKWVQSVHKALNNGITMGTPTGSNPSNLGTSANVYTQFDRGNGSGVLIRVQGSSDNEPNVPYRWAPGSATTTINHGLGRQPIGFYVVDCDGATQVYRTAPPTDKTITLNTTSHGVSTTLYIF